MALRVTSDRWSSSSAALGCSRGYGRQRSVDWRFPCPGTWSPPSLSPFTTRAGPPEARQGSPPSGADAYVRPRARGLSAANSHPSAYIPGVRLLGCTSGLPRPSVRPPTPLSGSGTRGQCPDADGVLPHPLSCSAGPCWPVLRYPRCPTGGTRVLLAAKPRRRPLVHLLNGLSSWSLPEASEVPVSSTLAQSRPHGSRSSQQHAVGNPYPPRMSEGHPARGFHLPSTPGRRPG